MASRNNDRQSTGKAQAKLAEEASTRRRRWIIKRAQLNHARVDHYCHYCQSPSARFGGKRRDLTLHFAGATGTRALVQNAQAFFLPRLTG